MPTQEEPMLEETLSGYEWITPSDRDEAQRFITGLEQRLDDLENEFEWMEFEMRVRRGAIKRRIDEITARIQILEDFQ